MWRAVAACCLVLLVCPRPAAAEWHITPTFGMTFAGKTTLQDFEHATDKIHPVFGIGGTYLTSGIFGFEALAIITPHFFETGSLDLIKTSRATALMGNVMVTVPRKWAEYSLRPFVSGGFGLLRTSQVDPNAKLGVTSNIAGFNIGGGAVGYFSKRTGVRFDFRYYSNLHGGDQLAPDGAVAIGDVQLRYMTLTVGLVFRR